MVMVDDERDWLEISIDFLPSGPAELVIEVTFANCSPSKGAVYWKFRNVLGKAEGHSLQLRALDGQRLEPVDFMVGTPSSPPEPDEFRFGDTQKYVLRGQVEHGKLLRFPGASYLVSPGAEYDVSFHYGRADSNHLKWQAPNEI
jgi:hypothetical protein